MREFLVLIVVLIASLTAAAATETSEDSIEGFITESAIKESSLSPNKSDEIELELTRPLSISREQFLRFRKFLTRKGIMVKRPEGEEEEVGHRIRVNLDVARGKKRTQMRRLSDVTAEDILPFLPKNLSSLVPILDELKGEQCRRHGKFFLQGLHNLTKWAVQMFDAATKIPEGILVGSSFHFGNFDECLDLSVDLSSSEQLKGQYCLATVILSGLSQDQVQEDPLVFTRTAWDDLKVPNTRAASRKDVLHWAFCLPAACSPDDIQRFLSRAVDASTLHGLQLDFEIPPNMCQIKRDFLFDQYDIALAIIFGIFFLFVGVASALDIFVSRQHNSRLSSNFYFKMLLCFSAPTNIKKLTAFSPSPHNLDCIFGIKAITMSLILMGHATAFIMGGPSMNSDFKEEAILKVENGILLNNPLLVDTFLMIGAFLLCKLLLVELEKRKFINPLILYIARIIRLTPAYAVVIAIYCTWFYKMGSGPLWEAKIGLERERCQNSWWGNILYINNYVNSEYLCMFQSWYLAVDTQFFFLAPFLIYPLWKWSQVGEILLATVTLISIAIPFALTYINNLDPVLMMYAREISDLSSNPTYRTAYIKTHMRGMSYMIGTFLGYIVHKVQVSGQKVPKYVIWSGWIIGSFTSLSAMFTVAIFYRRPYDALEAASYAALHRVGWCIGVAWIIFACVTNNAGPIDNFLRRRIWIPFSRLSYCSYLVNGLVELHAIGTLRQTRYLSNFEIAKVTISHIILTYSLALFFSTIFEAPILGIENLLLKNADRGQKNREEKTSNSSLSVESAQTSTSSSSSSSSSSSPPDA